jgi:Zn-dependent protease
MTERLFYLILLLPAFVTSLSIHEFAHAWAGYKLGDDTAKQRGRLTLDPMAHLDPVGFFIIVVAVLINAPLIGWAKPVPFNPRNLSHPRRDSILIAVAGPISNVLQALCWLLALFVFRIVLERTGIHFDVPSVIDMIGRQPNMASIPQVIATMMTAGVLVNVVLAVFNMIPIPPLDGHYVLEGIGPPFITDLYNAIRSQPFLSYILLLVLLQTPFLEQALAPFTMYAYRGILWAFGVSV